MAAGTAFRLRSGVLAAVTIRNPSRAKSAETTPQEFNCCLEGPPLRNPEPAVAAEAGK